MKNKRMMIAIACVAVVVLVSVSLGIFLSHRADVKENMIIETPYGDLRYPKKWEAQACFEFREDTVTCYAAIGEHERIAVFDVYLGQDEGYPIGTLDGVKVNVKTHELELDDSWTQEEVQTVYTMQEDINHLIQKLQENRKFSLSGT